MINNLISKIKTSKDVLGVISMGSTANSLSEYSDIDLAIILRDDTPKLFSALGFHSKHVLDLYFFKESQIRNISKNEEKIDGYSMDGKIVQWVHVEKIEYDEADLLKNLKENKSVDDLDYQIDDKEKRRTWFDINFNFHHNQRYLRSNSSTYLKALEIRLLYSIMDLITGYMKFRDIPWAGEKDAIKYLEKHDTDYLSKYFSCIRESNVEKKFQEYQQLVQKTIAPYKQTTEEDEIITSLNGDAADYKEASTFVGNLISLQ